MSDDPRAEPTDESEVVALVSAVAVEIPAAARPDVQNKLGELGKAGDCAPSLEEPVESDAEEDKITECHVFDVQDLGEVGVGVRMFMDTPEDVHGGGMYFDSYLFKRSERAYALHVTWFNGTNSPLDALQLARTMDRRAH